jgi:hypothetical protein
MLTRESLVIMLGICGILFLAVGLPLGIYFSFRRSRGPSTGEVLNRAGKGVRKPWSEEDAALDQLSQEVSRLNRPKGNQPPTSEEKPGSGGPGQSS